MLIQDIKPPVNKTFPILKALDKADRVIDLRAKKIDDTIKSLIINMVTCEAMDGLVLKPYKYNS